MTTAVATDSSGSANGMPNGIAVGGSNAEASVRTRARIANTLRHGKVSVGAVHVASTVASDLRGAWAWRDVPPSLRAVWAQRVPAADRVPGNCETPGSVVLHKVWVVYNHAVALPVTAVMYSAAWLLQHPVRAFPTVITVVALLAMWLN